MVAFENNPDVPRRTSSSIPDGLDLALKLLKALILRAPARRIYLEPRYTAPTLIFSDASWHPEENAEFPCRIGAIVFSQRLPRPRGFTSLVSHGNLDALQVRVQQITPCETMAASIILEHCPESLENMDALWFIDNTGSEAVLIAGYSGSPASAAMIGTTHIILASLNARVWWERVPSGMNPSDGLSRDGLQDSWTKAQPWDCYEVDLPDWSNLKDPPLDTLLERFAEVTSRIPDAEVRTAPVAWVRPEVSAEDLSRQLRTETSRVSDSSSLGGILFS